MAFLWYAEHISERQVCSLWPPPFTYAVLFFPFSILGFFFFSVKLHLSFPDHLVDVPPGYHVLTVQEAKLKLRKTFFPFRTVAVGAFGWWKVCLFGSLTHIGSNLLSQREVETMDKNMLFVTLCQLGRASCRERVASPVEIAVAAG